MLFHDHKSVRATFAIGALSALVVAELFALAGGAHLYGADIGLVANSPREAKNNTARLTKAWTASPPKMVTLPPGDTHIVGTPAMKPVVGCGGWQSSAPGGYSIDPGPVYGQVGCRVIQDGKGPILDLPGAGFEQHGCVELVGNGTDDLIQIEGRSAPATGRHHFEHLILRNAPIGIHCLATPEEDHADNCYWDIVETFNVDTDFRSDNQQALNHTFGVLTANVLGKPKEHIVFDVKRGGWITCHVLNVEQPICVVEQFTDYSPNTCAVQIGNLHVDRNVGGGKLTLFRYAGPVWDDDMSWIKPRLRITDGHSANLGNDQYDQSKLIDIPDSAAKVGIDRSDITYDVWGLK